MTVQTLGPEQARRFVAEFERRLEAGTLPSEAVGAVVNAVRMLPEDERAPWLRHWHCQMLMALYDTRSKSTAYYLHGLHKTAAVLARAGLIDMDNGFRDVETGRKVKSIVGELSRPNWDSDETLIYAYRDLRDEPLATVKDIVRLLNPRVQTLDPQDEELQPSDRIGG